MSMPYDLQDLECSPQCTLCHLTHMGAEFAATCDECLDDWLCEECWDDFISGEYEYSEDACERCLDDWLCEDCWADFMSYEY